MSSTTTSAPSTGGGLRQTLDDGLVVTWRYLKRIPRIPELAIFAIIQSIMFVLLFTIVFGGAIVLPGGASYAEYLMPGIFVQTLTFAAATTAIGMTEDLNKGIIDRFRSLPMARSAVLFGRSVSDVVYNGGILLVLIIAGLAVGWRVNSDLFSFAFGVVLLLAYAFVMSWVGVWLGLRLPSVEVAQQVSFIVILPLTFISNVFVPVGTLPDWLQPIAAWNPVSTLTASLRELWGNPNPFPTSGLPAEYPILVTLGWYVALLLVFAPLGVRRYRTISR